MRLTAARPVSICRLSLLRKLHAEACVLVFYRQLIHIIQGWVPFVWTKGRTSQSICLGCE